MRLCWGALFKSKVNAEVHWDRWDVVALGLAVSAVIWVFVFKLKTFYALGYTSDLFVHVQLARSWLEGRGLLQDNCFGNHLAMHTYFLLLPLGFIAKPFGAPGLLFVLAASVGAAYFWATRILRLLGVDGGVAIIAAGVVLISPLSVAFYQHPGFGFHVEILALFSLKKMLDVGLDGGHFGNNEYIGAKVENLFGDVVVDSGDKGDDCNDRAHADYHSQ